MKKAVALVAVLLLAAFVSGCAMTGSNSRTGQAVINMQTEAGEATGLPAGDKEGKACSQNILGLFASGDSSIVAAMEDGDITKVSTVDFKYMQFLMFYGEVCTIVTGN